MGAPKLYKGKQKSEIATEAFDKLGKDATQEQVSRYFQRHYGLSGCEQSMYYNAKRMAQGQPSYTAQRKKGGGDTQPNTPTKEKTVPTTPAPAPAPKLHEEPAKTGSVSKKDAIVAVLNDMGIDTETSKVIAEVKKRYKLDVNNKRIWDIRSELKGQTANQPPRARVQSGVTPPPSAVEEQPVQTAAVIEAPTPATVVEEPAPVNIPPMPRLAETLDEIHEGQEEPSNGLFSPPIDVVTPLEVVQKEPEPPLPTDPLTNILSLKGLVASNGLTLEHVKKVLGMADRMSLDGLKMAVTTLEDLQLSK
jgi:hypothetical protein